MAISKGGEMSVKRDVIAEALGVKEENVKCENCPSSREFINDMIICDFWNDLWTPKDGFCSFWRNKNAEPTEKSGD